MARKPSAAEKSLRADYLDYAEAMAARSERDTNGVLWNARGRAARDAGRMVQWDLFTRSWAHMSPYASEELLTWFAIHGRMTFADYREQLRASNRDAYEAYLESIA